MNNRLQFVHNDTVFGTREEAKDYIEKAGYISYPALYAEPMVVKYGDEANPNVILAIGSKGDGTTPSIENRIFCIDFAELKESIEELKSSNADVEELKETLKSVIASCGINEDGTYTANAEDEILSKATTLTEADSLLSQAIKANYEELTQAIQDLSKTSSIEAKDTDTIKTVIDKTDEGNVISSEVKLAEYMTVGNTNLDNILVKKEDGIYANVRMSYDAKANKISFGVNGEEKTFDLPTEIHLAKGEYDTDTESIILTLSNGETVNVDCTKLIGEWTVLGEQSETPIVLTKEVVTSKEILRGAAEYQDILKADIRLANEVYEEINDNILQRYNKNTLYVKGTADNIKFMNADGTQTTVQNALQKIKPKVSTRDYNILTEKEDGLYVRAKMSFDERTNTLTFDDGINPIQNFKINTSSVLYESIYYDSATEEIVVLYRKPDSTIAEARIPVTHLITEWDVNNEFHTVKLTKTEHQVAGKDMLSADVNILDMDDNILEVVGHSLYVKGTAANIRYKNGTVKEALDNIATTDNVEDLKNLIAQEAELRKAADDEIKAIANEAKLSVSGLNYQVQENTKDIAAETEERKKNEKLIGDAVSQNVQTINEVKENLSILRSDFDNFEEKADSVHTQMASAITTLHDGIAENTSGLTALNTKVDAIDKKLEDHINSATGEINEEVKKLQSDVADLKVDVAANEQNISSVNTKLDDHIASTKTVHEQLAQSIQGLTEDLAEETARAKEVEGNLTNAITAETQRAQGEEKRLETLINNNVSGISSNTAQISDLTSKLEKANEAIRAEVERSTNADTAISGAVDTNAANLQAEITRAKEAEGKLESGVNKNATDILALKDEINSIDAGVLNIVPQETNTVKIATVKSENGKTVTISGDVKIKTDVANVITYDGNGIYANVNLQYNKAENKISLLINGKTVNEYELSEHSLVQEGHYESTTQSIVLTIVKDGGETQQISIPVGDIVNEWTVDNGTNNPISLSKTPGSDGVDVLKAELEISTEAHNAILNHNGTLYVSNQAKDLTALWGGDEITIQKAIENIKTETDKVEGIFNDVENLKTDMTQVKNDLTNLQGDVTNLETKVEQNTNDININKGSIDTLNKQYLDLSSQVTNLKNDFNELQTVVENYENRITNLESGVTAINQNIQNITQQINDIQEEIGGGGQGEPSIKDRLNAIEAVLADLIDFGTYSK